MRTLTLCTALLCLNFTTLAALWNNGASIPQEDLDQFDALNYGGMPYRFLLPAGYNPAQSYPLLVSMHGGAGMGDDNESQMLSWTKNFVNGAWRSSYKSIVICPQSEGQWFGSNLSKAFGIIDKVRQDYNIDDNRIYIIGHSAGAYGTWNALTTQPDLFAAAITSAGGLSSLQSNSLIIKDIPIWNFHGANDTTISVENSRAIFTRMEEIGGNLKYSEMPGTGHGVDKYSFARNGTQWAGPYPTQFASAQVDRTTSGQWDWLFSQGVNDANIPVQLPFSDDFETGLNPANDSAAPYPTGVWHMQNALGNGWSVEAQDTSVVIDDINENSNSVMQLGWGYDEVAVLFSTTTPIDLTKDYKFSGSWEIDTVFSPRGFIAGIAEFSSTNGALVQRLTPDSNVFGNTVSPTLGETGSFEVIVTSAQLQSAGVTAGNTIGMFLHRDDDGILYDEADGFTDKNDVYLVDDIHLYERPPFEQWMLTYSISGATNDADGDGVVNLVEFALGGNPTNPLVTGEAPWVETGAGGVKFVYPRRIVSGLEYTVETCTNLLAGTWSTNGTVELAETGSMNDDFESVTNEITSANSQTFIRLQVSQ